jgi:hypothetical protein
MPCRRGRSARVTRETAHSLSSSSLRETFHSHVDLPRCSLSAPQRGPYPLRRAGGKAYGSRAQRRSSHPRGRPRPWPRRPAPGPGRRGCRRAPSPTSVWWGSVTRPRARPPPGSVVLRPKVLEPALLPECPGRPRRFGRATAEPPMPASSSHHANRHASRGS